MTIQFSTPWRVLASHVQQYWIGNRESSIKNLRSSVSDALDIRQDQLIIYDEREVIVAYMRSQAIALRSRFTFSSHDTTAILIREVADAVEAMAQRIQNGEHVEYMVGDFALSPYDIKKLKRARNGQTAEDQIKGDDNVS